MPKNLTQQEVLNRFHKRWGNTYTYPRMFYVNRRTKVLITCPIHGDFPMLPLEHAKGHGCPKCGNKSQAQKLSKPKKDKKWLLEKLHEIYGDDTYDFSLIEDESFVYNGVKTKLPLICKKCGTFSMSTAAEKLSGSGCNTCRLKKFSKVNLGKSRPLDERCLVAGVGVNDVEGVMSNDPIYHIWREMITRCYNEDYWKKRPSYEHCVVCEDWKKYSNYLNWYNENKVEGFDVDKDLLSFYKKSKTYSPDTCCFLPSEINNALASTKSKQRKYPLGVHNRGGCITASCGNEYLGTFKTVSEAHNAYLTAKKQRITYLTEKWKDKIEKRVYDALVNLNVEEFFNN